jgi:MFS family permease
VAVGAPSAGLLIDHFGLRSGYYGAPLFALAGTVVILVSFRRARWGKADVAPSGTPGPGLARGISVRPLLMPCAVVMLMLVGTGAEGSFLPLLVTGPLHGGAAEAGIAAAVVGALGGLLMVPGGRVGDSYGRRLAIVLGIVLSAAGLVGYAVAGVYAAVLAAALVRALGSALAWPALTAVLADDAPPASRGVVMAIYGEFESVGLALGPLIAGLAAGSFGLGAAFGITAVIAILALAALPLSRPRRNSAAAPMEVPEPAGTKT